MEKSVKTLFQFEAVIADYGLSAVCLKEKGRQRAEDCRTSLQDYIASQLDCLRHSFVPFLLKTSVTI